MFALGHRTTALLVAGLPFILNTFTLLAYDLLQERTWGGPDREGAQGVAAAADGSVYVTGGTRSFGAASDEDAFLLKYAADGTLLWQRTYGTAPDELNSGLESGIDVAVAPDNSGIVVLGNYRDGNIFLAKFSTEGTVIWDLTWGGNQEGATALAIAPDGTIYATGATSAFGAGEADAFLLSFTPTGTLNWQRTWGGDFFDVARGVAVATDGNIFITGDTGNSAFLVKFSPAGTVGVQREWGVVGRTGIPNDDQTFAFGIAAAPDGGVFVVGDTSGTGFNPNLLAARFDSGGNIAWLRVGGPGFGSAQDVAVGADGSLHITGNVLTEPSGADAFVWNVLANGKGNNAAVWGGGDPFEGERGASIATAPGGAIVVAGSAGAPPYAFGRGSKNAKAADTFLVEFAGTVTVPAGVVGVTAAVVAIPAGSETFAGSSDAFLLRIQP
jgi:hypothetical protein